MFSFFFKKISPENQGEIIYNLPVKEDGTYQLSFMYLPDEKNASNCSIEIHHADGVSIIQMDMKKGDKFGFALEIGKY